MKLNQFYNKTIIIENLKRFFGVSILYFIAIFVKGPLYLYSKSDMSSYHDLERAIQIINEDNAHGVIAIMGGILFGVLIFRYLHNKNSVAVIHGYPFRRSELLNSHVISGIILISIPIIINTIIFALITPSIITNISASHLPEIHNLDIEKITELYSIRKIIYWFLKMEIVSIIFFLISTFAGIISGITIVQGALAFILPFVPVFIINLVYEGLRELVFGFGSIGYKWREFAENIIPIYLFDSIKNWNINYIMWYIVLAILLYSLCLWLYMKRDLERSQDTIAFDILKPVFKYGVTFCAMLLAGSYFQALKESAAWFWIGGFIGSFLGYFIAEIIMEKSIRVFGKFKGYILYIAVIALIITVTKIDLFGYEKRIPSSNEVKEAYFECSHLRDATILEGENIESILGIHQFIIDNKNYIIEETKDSHFLETTYIDIGYLYTNGRRMFRTYKLPTSLLVDTHYLKELYQAEESKRIKNRELLELNLDEVKEVRIINDNYDKRKILLDKKEIEELTEILKREVFAQSYESMMDSKAWSRIAFDIGDDEHKYSSRFNIYSIVNSEKDIRVNFNKSYLELEEWFKNKGYLQDVRIMPEEVKYIVIKESESNREYRYTYDEDELENDFKKGKGKKVEIKDKEEIETILRSYNERWAKDRKYIVGIYTKSGKVYYGWYDEKNALKYFK